jgi:membrane protein YdbS with pleckstrin-like domain
MTPQQPVPMPPQAPVDDRVAPPVDEERVYFEGSPMLRGELLFTTTWMVVGLLIAAAGPALAAFEVVESMPWWGYLIGIVLGLLCIVIPILITKRTRYRISNYRIDREIGLLSKRIETLELWHVEDIQYYQSLIDRMLRVGTITVISHDDTTPRLELKSLPNPRPLFDSLKNRIIAVKRQRGVIKFDHGGHGLPNSD